MMKAPSGRYDMNGLNGRDDMMRRQVSGRCGLGILAIVVVAMALPVWAAESAEEAAGAGRLLRKEGTPPAAML